MFGRRANATLVALCQVTQLRSKSSRTPAGRYIQHADRTLAAARCPRPRRRSLALTFVLATVATLCVCFNATAQAHVPYLVSDWGLNFSGQLGDGTSEGPELCFQSAEPCDTSAAEVSGVSPVVAVAAGEEHSLAVMNDGTVRAWGNNEFGQLGDGIPGVAQGESDQPVAVSGLCCASAVAAGGKHSLALLSGGEVRAWGSNESGQLGDKVSPERNPTSSVPVVVDESRAPIRNVTAIAAGEEHSLALLSTGEVRAWGNGESGQLGDENLQNKKEAVPVRKLKDAATSVATSVAAGEEDSVALLSDGTVMAWGANNVGQLGNGTFTGPDTCTYGPCSRTAEPVPGLSGVVKIAAGGNHSLALLSNGTVMAWGENGSGQLGNGTTTNSAVPLPVQGLSGVIAIAAGQEYSLALLANGTVMAWGANGEGQLGAGFSFGPQKCGPPNNEEACSTTPITVSGLRNLDVRGIAAGGWHSLAYGPPNPTVTAVSPREGLEPGGTLVTITGTEFTGASAVKFGTTEATAFHVESPTSITAVSPKGAGVVDVTVTTPEGTSPTSGADQFSYVPPLRPAPVVVNISPKEGAESGGTSVTITGANLAGASSVKFGSVGAPSFTLNSQGTAITAVSPPGSGLVDVTVTTGAGTSATTAADQFSYVAVPPPTVTGIQPSSGPWWGGTLVTITGTNLLHATAVRFGENEARFLAVSETTLEAVAPSHSIQLLSSEAVDVTVAAPGGESEQSPADEFTYTPTGASGVAHSASNEAKAQARAERFQRRAKRSRDRNIRKRPTRVQAFINGIR
jgi:alpha-tubulin suppressor-like RCC1 family protein